MLGLGKGSESCESRRAAQAVSFCTHTRSIHSWIMGKAGRAAGLRVGWAFPQNAVGDASRVGMAPWCGNAGHGRGGCLGAHLSLRDALCTPCSLSFCFPQRFHTPLADELALCGVSSAKTISSCYCCSSFRGVIRTFCRDLVCPRGSAALRWEL